MKSNDRQIGTKPTHPLIPAVSSVLERFVHKENITNHAFNEIRNQMQVRVLLVQEFDYLPDCATCPMIWTKRGSKPISLDDLKERESTRIQEMLSTKGSFLANEVAFDLHVIRGIINRLKNAGWQIVTNKNIDNSVIGYSLKHKPAQLQSKKPKQEKAPSLAGNRA